MKTLQIGDRWLSEAEGGLSRYYYELLRHLPPNGVQVRGLVVGGSGISNETQGLVRAFAPADAALLKRLRAERAAAIEDISNFAPDLIVSHFALYSLPLLDRLSRTPNVFHFHGPWSGESSSEGDGGLSSRVKTFIENMAYQRAKRIIVLSQAFASELVKRYRVSEDAIRIVPGGIDIDRFNVLISRTDARVKLDLPSGCPIVFCIRRQVRRMGLENLVAAMETVVNKVPEALLLLGGVGPLLPELTEIIIDRGLAANVKQLGRVQDTDLPLYYRAADLSIAPTVALEGFGLITLESLACGTPVLVTPVGGLKEVVYPLSPACVLTGSTPDALADGLLAAILGFISVPGEMDCRRYASENFSWGQIAGKVASVYHEALCLNSRGCSS